MRSRGHMNAESCHNGLMEDAVGPFSQANADMDLHQLGSVNAM